MFRWSMVALLFGIGCHPHAPHHSPSMIPPIEISDAGMVDKLAGSHVYVEGQFHSERGIHGWVTLDSGVRLFLPDLKDHLRGLPWTSYEGQRVRVGGTLRSRTTGVPGIEGPSLAVNDFSVYP
jgi:hypothetical protein